MKKILIFIWSLILITSCEKFWTPSVKKEEAVKETTEKKVRNGTIRNYRDNGTLYSEITYVNGVREGLAKRYTESEALLYEIPYKKGEKHGISKSFYENGKIRRSTDYVTGEMHGKRRTFYTTGTLASEISYQNDMPGNDLKEYYKSGKLKTEYPDLKVELIDNSMQNGKYILKAYFTKTPRRGQYFLGELVEGKYFDQASSTPMKMTQEGGTVVFEPPPGTFLMQKIHIIGKFKTARGNPLIKTTIYNLAIEG